MKRITAVALLLSLAWCANDAPAIRLRQTVNAYLNAERLASTDSLLSVLKAARPHPDSVYAVLAGLKFSPEKPGHRTVKLLNTDGVMRSIGIHVPAGYDPARRYPLLVWLHGGVNGSNPDKGAYAYRSFMADTLDASRFCLSVTGQKGATWFDPKGMANIEQGLRYVKRHFNIDDDRVTLAGISDGGTGCYFQGNLNAGPYAGFACMSSYPAMLTKMKIPMHTENMRQRRWFIIHTGKDRLYPGAVVREYVKFFQYAGVPLAGKFFPDKGHDLGGFRDDALPAVYAWMDSLVRTVPDTIDWAADALQFGRFEWIQMEEGGATPTDFKFKEASELLKKLAVVNPASARVRAVRSGNTVRLQTANVRKVSILVSPATFNMDEKLLVYANGVLVFNKKVEPDAVWMLRNFRQYRDRQRIYVAKVLVDVYGK